MDRAWQAWVDVTLRSLEPHPEARVALIERLREAGELEFVWASWTLHGSNKELKRVLRRLALERL